MKLNILIAGFGHVGRRFERMLRDHRSALTGLGIEPVVVGVTTARHGAVFDGAGLDVRHIAQGVTEGTAGHSASVPPTLEWIARLRSLNAEARVLVETTPLDVRSGEPAISHVRAAFAAGAHVVTANKGPAAWAYRELSQAALDANLSFLFESAVMDGIPVLNLVRDTLPGASIRGFRGVVNSTTNFILTAIERGEGYDEALARMQAAGVAEADASLDVDGWDSAAKAAVLANVLLDANITPPDIVREGIGPDTAERAVAARAGGRRLKLVAHAARRTGGVDAGVELQALEPDDPLAILDGQANALELDTDEVGRVVITQRDGGLDKTAYGLLSDLVTVARRLGARGPVSAP